MIDIELLRQYCFLTEKLTNRQIIKRTMVIVESLLRLKTFESILMMQAYNKGFVLHKTITMMIMDLLLFITHDNFVSDCNIFCLITILAILRIWWKWLPEMFFFIISEKYFTKCPKCTLTVLGRNHQVLQDNLWNKWLP